MASSDEKSIENVQRNLLGRKKIQCNHCNCHTLYKSIFLPDDKWWNEANEELTFSNKNLDMAAKCVRKFLNSTRTWGLKGTEWYHIRISARIYEFFYKFMLEENHKSVILPFWCWCDGGYLGENDLDHRHMIIVSSDDHFRKNLWPSFVNQSNYVRYKNCKLKIDRIYTAKELVDTLGFVSQKDSFCVGEKNYFINLSLPANFKWILGCLWDTGLGVLIMNEYSKLTLRDEIVLAKKNIIGFWEISPISIPTIPNDFVIPVSKQFKPTNHSTPYYLYMNENEKIYFEKDLKLLTLNDDEWNELQVNSGNIFYNFLSKQKTIIPSNGLYTTYEIVHTFIEENFRLLKENEELRKK